VLCHPLGEAGQPAGEKSRGIFNGGNTPELGELCTGTCS